MKKKAGIIIGVIAAAAGIWQGMHVFVFFHGYAGLQCYQLTESASMETAAAVQAAKEGELPDLVFWDAADYQTVLADAPAKRAERVSVVTICGNPEYLTGQFSIPQYGDTKNCLLDRKTAWNLFGTGEAVGETVQYQGKAYRIKGILEEIAPTLLIQASADYDGGFTRVTAADNGNMQDWELENKLQNRYGMSLVKTDWGIVRAAVKLFFCAAVLSVYSSAAKNVCRRKTGGKTRTDRTKAEVYSRVHVIYVAAGVLLLAVLLQAAGIRGLPAKYIPPKWSDFEFYEKARRSLCGDFKNLLRLHLSTFELKMLKNSMILCADTALACLSARHLLKILYGETARQKEEE